jgi:hypothetical protein
MHNMQQILKSVMKLNVQELSKLLCIKQWQLFCSYWEFGILQKYSFMIWRVLEWTIDLLSANKGSAPAGLFKEKSEI